MAKRRYPECRSVAARIEHVAENVAHVIGILAMMEALATEAKIPQPIIDQAREARQRLESAQNALGGE